jgi:hypothetical protein
MSQLVPLGPERFRRYSDLAWCIVRETRALRAPSAIYLETFLRRGRRRPRLKRYEAAKTLYQRVLADTVLTPEQQHALSQQVHALDPIALARDILQTLDVLWKLADTRCTPEEGRPWVTQF